MTVSCSNKSSSVYWKLFALFQSDLVGSNPACGKREWHKMICKVPSKSNCSVILQNGSIFLGILYLTLLAEQARITLALIYCRERQLKLSKISSAFSEEIDWMHQCTIKKSAWDKWQLWQENENNFHVFIAALEAIDKQYTSYINEHVSIYDNKNKLQWHSI